MTMSYNGQFTLRSSAVLPTDHGAMKQLMPFCTMLKLVLAGLKTFYHKKMLSVESQKGINAIQSCNLLINGSRLYLLRSKRMLTVHHIFCRAIAPFWFSICAVLTGFKINNTLLALNRQYAYSYTVRAPVFGRHRFFGTSEHYRKAHGSLLSGSMNYNYTACCWFPTSSNILIHHSSDKSGLKVAD